MVWFLVVDIAKKEGKKLFQNEFQRQQQYIPGS